MLGRARTLARWNGLGKKESGAHRRRYGGELKSRQTESAPKPVERHRYVAFYKYAKIDEVEKASDDLRSRLEALGGLGRIYVSREGLNAQMSVPLLCYDAWRYSLSKFCDKWGIGEVTMSEGGVAAMQGEKTTPFTKLTVKVRDRIVQDALPSGLDSSLDMSHTSHLALSADQWHDRLARAKAEREGKSEKMKVAGKNRNSGDSNDPIAPNAGEKDGQEDLAQPVVVDCRNWYESEVGRFEQAIRLPVDRYSESFDAIDEVLRDVQPNQEVLLYCTGGIRCEKIGAYLTQVKNRSNVHTLEGGINRYHKFIKGQPIDNPSHAHFDGLTLHSSAEISKTNSEEEIFGQSSPSSPSKATSTGDNIRPKPLESFYKGINYQFDKRNLYYGFDGAKAPILLSETNHAENEHSGLFLDEAASDADRVTEDVLSKCSACQRPSDAMYNCANTLCNLLVVLCSSCRSKMGGACSSECHRLSLLSKTELASYSRTSNIALARHLNSRALHRKLEKPCDASTTKDNIASNTEETLTSPSSGHSSDSINHNEINNFGISQLLPQSSASLPFVRSKSFLSDVLQESSAMDYRRRILSILDDSKTKTSDTPFELAGDGKEVGNEIISSQLPRMELYPTVASSKSSKGAKKAKKMTLTGEERLKRDNAYRMEGTARITPMDVQEYVERYSTHGISESSPELDFNDERAQMSVGSFLGSLLTTLARTSSSRRVLEIGTFLGYSALCFSEAVSSVRAQDKRTKKSDPVKSFEKRFPDASDEYFVLSCDLDHIALEKARLNASKHPSGDLIHFDLNSGMSCLEKAINAKLQFDTIFVDADKHNFANYYNTIIDNQLLSPNGLLIFDNTLWRGDVVNSDAEISSNAVQTSSKGDSATPPGRVSTASILASSHGKGSKNTKKQHVLHSFNKLVAQDQRTTKTILPIRDGLTLISWAPL